MIGSIHWQTLCMPTKTHSRSPESGPTLSGARRWLGLTFAAAATGALFMPCEWYAGLIKTAWNPPNGIFGSGLDGTLFRSRFKAEFDKLEECLSRRSPPPPW